MKAPKYTRSICVGGLGVLAAASLLAAALPAVAEVTATPVSIDAPIDQEPWAPSQNLQSAAQDQTTSI